MTSLSSMRQEAQRLHQQHRLAEADVRFKQVLALAPNDPDALYGVGIIAYQQGRFPDAVTLLGRAINALPTEPNLWARRALALMKLQRFDDAIPHFDQALRLNPRHLEALNNRALAKKKVGRLEDAIADLERALSLTTDPTLRVATLALVVHWKMHICQWDGFDAACDQLLRASHAGYATFAPFVGLNLLDAGDALLKAAEHFTRKLPAPTLPAFEEPPRTSAAPSPARIRLGYFSADFHNHATMHLMAELFEHHDRSRFELIAFSFGPIRDDPWRARAIAAFDVFHDIGPLTDVDAAALARKCQIDIAIDLKGHTRDSRPGLFAERVAPLQVNYLGYPGTMGAPFMDYLIADAVIIPPTHEAHYREKVIRLPDCYQPNCRHRDIDPTPVTRATYGLPETAFVFCSFNAIHKVTPSIFSIWLRLLHEVDGSVLWLLANEPRARENLRACAAREGVDPDRLIFASTVPVETHLARLPLADLMLDTFPCNAHTTASDALRMGLPLVTLMGQSFASRVAASLLHAVGLPELITTSLDAYEALAISLGRDREALAKIKSKLRDNLPTAPLFDSLETTRHLESAYLEMVTRHRRGEAPAHFGVLEDGTVQ